MMTAIDKFINKIICGDCLAVMKTMPDSSIDMIITDPPYGHNNNNGDLIHRSEAALGRLPSGSDSPLARPIANDGAEANDLFKAFIAEAARILKPGSCCCCCCCGGGGPDPQFARWSLWMDEVLDFKQMVVWDKGPMGMGWHYRRSYETILVAQKSGAACKWYDETNKIENIIRPQHKINKIIPNKDQHPTPKPVSLGLHFISLHSKPGDIVFDPFCGGGPFMEACAVTGRNYIGIELNPEYVAMAEQRIARATAQMRLFV